MTLEACIPPGPVPVRELPNISSATPKSGLLRRTRLLSLLALCGTLVGVGYAGLTAYRLMTDSFIAPIILSKDSDVVVQSKLSLSRVLAERHTLVSRIEDNQSTIEASEKAIARLNEVKTLAERSLDWTVAITSKQAAVSGRDLAALDGQKAVIQQMIEHEQTTVAEMKEYLAAGLIHKSELTREEASLNQLRVAALSNDRDRLATEVQRHTATLAQASLRQPNAKDLPSTPEMMMHQDQVVKLDLDILKLETEARSKRVQLRYDETELAKLDELVGDMKARPIFRAIESSQNVAFVPYNQIEGVQSGGTVYDCALWGLFACKPVGHVAEVLPGEIAAQDPWGTPMRGQYAILNLEEQRAAQSRSLRVRSHGSKTARRNVNTLAKR